MRISDPVTQTQKNRWVSPMRQLLSDPAGTWITGFSGALRRRLMAVLLALPQAVPAGLPTSTELLAMVGIPQDKIARLDRGEVVSHDIGEYSERELAKIIAIYLPVSLEQVTGFLREVDLISIDPEVTAYSLIPRNASVDDFKGIAQSFRGDEALDILESRAGEHFNLSSTEITSFGQLRNHLPVADTHRQIELAAQQYQKLLFQRWQSYRSKGLAGIAAYTREDGATSPAEELDDAARNCKLLSAFFPQLYDGWLNYPAGLPAGVEEHFYWLNRRVENRPTMVLGHRMFQTTGDGTLVVERQFYVGHSYNSTHQIVGALPYRTGTLVFYAERTSTDQVAGLASGLRHDIGRRQLQAEMTDRLKRLSKSLQNAGDK